MHVTRCRGRERTRRTDEAAGRFLSGFGTRADIAYSLDIFGRKAEFITLEHDKAVFDPKVQRRDDVICICVVVRILDKLEQKVGFFVVQVARKSVERVWAGGRGIEGRKRLTAQERARVCRGAHEQPEKELTGRHQSRVVHE